jgi:hypothetical protein
MIREEGLDAHSDPGLHLKPFLEDWKKGKDLVRREIEFDGENRMNLVFKGMGSIVFHGGYEEKFESFTGRREDPFRIEIGFLPSPGNTCP